MGLWSTVLFKYIVFTPKQGYDRRWGGTLFSRPWLGPVVRVIICLTETKHTIRRLFWRRVACYSVADQYPEIMTSRNLETAHRKGEGVLARVVHRALLHEKGPQSGPPYPSLCPKVLDTSIVARVQIQHFHGYIGYPSCRRRCASATHSKV